MSRSVATAAPASLIAEAHTILFFIKEAKWN